MWGMDSTVDKRPELFSGALGIKIPRHVITPHQRLNMQTLCCFDVLLGTPEAQCALEGGLACLAQS